MAEINKIQSFKTFSEIKLQEKEAQLKEEAQLKRSEITNKIAEILAEMEVDSIENLDETQRQELVNKIFGNVEEDRSEDIEDEIEDLGEPESLEEDTITEAIKVEGKRDAKKVLTQYNRIFNKNLVDLGAMSDRSILGCIKYLMVEALHDANFHRVAEPVGKMIKGNIEPLEIKMPGLGGHFIKIGPKSIKEILDKYYSDIANAAGWGGIGIVEGTALYLEQIKYEAMGQQALNKFNAAFEGEQVRVDINAKINESKVNEFTVINEGTRGQFGKIDKKGNITSVYTHYDSYPENMLPIIKKSFKGGKNVDNVIDKGANSGLDADISKINFYNDGSINTTGSIKNIDNYLKDVDRDGGAEFVYLWDEKSKKWMMADIYGGSGLVPAFESVVNEAEIKSDDEFKEYAETVLKKAFGEDYDEAKAGEVIDGILSKSDGDYGAAVGMLTGSLGESVVAEANADGTISDDEDDDMDNLKSDVEFMTKELIDHIKKETERIGGQFRAPGYEAEAKKIVKSIMQKKKFKL